MRALIEKYKPFQAFTRGDATQIIGEVNRDGAHSEGSADTAKARIAYQEFHVLERRESQNPYPDLSQDRMREGLIVDWT